MSPVQNYRSMQKIFKQEGQKVPTENVPLLTEHVQPSFLMTGRVAVSKGLDFSVSSHPSDCITLCVSFIISVLQPAQLLTGKTIST